MQDRFMTTDQTISHTRDVAREGTRSLKLSEPLKEFPLSIYEHGETLEHLDLSGTGLDSLPADLGLKLPQLRRAFFSSCRFTTFPKALASCPRLEMVAFRGNGMITIPEDSLPQQLRWLILTDNAITSLPQSIGQCHRLEKCMLAGNQLSELPETMQQCKRLGLLRLSCNQLKRIPYWLFEMPKLAFLSFASNPATQADPTQSDATPRATLPLVDWKELQVSHVLGQGASGVISKALWTKEDGRVQEVAVKLFKGALTSDGVPADEMKACIAAGQQMNIIDVLGKVQGHPDSVTGTFKGGLVMQIIPPHFTVLGGPPSFETCTRDTYPQGRTLSPSMVIEILRGIASAASHLHTRQIAHGDIYAHNILVDEQGNVVLGDFGAATVYDADYAPRLEKLEVLALANLVEDLVRLLPTTDANDQEDLVVRDQLKVLQHRCAAPVPADRATFRQALELLNHTI